MNTLGTKLLQLRHHWRLSAEELVAHLGVSKTAVNKWEADKSIPSLENTIKTCNYFEISIDNFIRGVQGICSLKVEAIQKSKYFTVDSKIIEILITKSGRNHQIVQEITCLTHKQVRPHLTIKKPTLPSRFVDLF